MAVIEDISAGFERARFDSQLSRMNCQTLRFSSGHFGQQQDGVMFSGTIRRAALAA